MEGHLLLVLGMVWDIDCWHSSEKYSKVLLIDKNPARIWTFLYGNGLRADPTRGRFFMFTLFQEHRWVVWIVLGLIKNTEYRYRWPLRSFAYRQAVTTVLAFFSASLLSKKNREKESGKILHLNIVTREHQRNDHGSSAEKFWSDVMAAIEMHRTSKRKNSGRPVLKPLRMGRAQGVELICLSLPEVKEN